MVRVSLVSQTILGLGSQVNPCFHRAVGKTPRGATEPPSSGQAFCENQKNFTENLTSNPYAVRPSAEFVGIYYDRRHSLRSQTGRGPPSGIFRRANWLTDMRLRFSLRTAPILALHVLKHSAHETYYENKQHRSPKETRAVFRGRLRSNACIQPER
jgi:hypothetical protein